jgi:predicted MFS family arabinose efflux permease
VFGNLYGAVGVAAGVSYALGGVLLDRTDARTTFVVAGAGGLVATALTALALRRRVRSSTDD